MKRTELEKLQARKIAAGGPGTPDRFGRDSAAPAGKREQRERDREAGLVPFAVKLHGDLVRELHAAAQARGVGLNELVGELLAAGLRAK